MFSFFYRESQYNILKKNTFSYIIGFKSLGFVETSNVCPSYILIFHI